MRLPFLLVFCFFLSVSHAQEISFQQPLNGELILSGNFGEVRGNHFHSGLDLKTNGKEGMDVYAIEDGHVRRIVVSPSGFGKALYVAHSNGTTSVYAHLRTFNPAISSYVKKQQYARKSFRLDLNLLPGKMKIEKGEIIAISGNSGGSGGPHLHFEIRESEGQIPENPLNYGFKVKDTRHPELQKLWVYEHSENGHVEGLLVEKGFKLNGKSGSYSMLTGDTIKANGALSFGIAALDRFSSSRNVCGIYSMTVKVNNQIIHQQQIDKFPFSKKRMVNCHVDYEKRKTDKQSVYRTYIAPNNKLDLYSNVRNGGVFSVKNGKSYVVEAIITDYAGNKSTVAFTIVGQERKGAVLSEPETVTDIFYPREENSFTNNSIRVSIPNGCLYDTLKFKYDLKPPCKDCISPIHSVGKLTDTPLDRSMTVSIKLNKVSEAAASKAVMVSFDEDGEPIAEGGSVKWNWMTTTTRSFGDYAVMLDSLAPQLRSKNFRNQTSTAGIDTLKFHFEDDLAGISSYSGTLNGKWVLLEHDPKNDLLYYVKDEGFISGQNTIRIMAEDKVGNARELSVTVK